MVASPLTLQANDGWMVTLSSIRHANHPHAIAWRIFVRIAEGDAEQQFEIIGYAKNTRMVPTKKPIDVCGNANV